MAITSDPIQKLKHQCSVPVSCILVPQVRGLYNVPRRRLPADPNEWHGRYRVGCQAGHKAPGFQDFAVYQTACPATTTILEDCSGTGTAMEILQLSCPIVVVRVCLPDLGIDVSSATRATEGENPSINQASVILSPKRTAIRHVRPQTPYESRSFSVLRGLVADPIPRTATAAGPGS